MAIGPEKNSNFGQCTQCDPAKIGQHVICDAFIISIILQQSLK